jgi:hypothetical protein
MQASWDVLREYPSHPDARRRWCDRVFYRVAPGRMQSLAELWQGSGPLSLSLSLGAVRALERWPLRPAVRLALSHGTREAA